MTRKEILTEIVTIRHRLLERCLNLQRAGIGYISEDEIDRIKLELLEAQLRLASEV